MPRRAKPTLRVSIYQVEEPLEARAAVRATYLDREGFAGHEVSVAGRQGLLVRGTVTREAAGWAPAFGVWVADPSLAADLGNRTAAAVLLLPTAEPSSGRLWALCAGTSRVSTRPRTSSPRRCPLSDCGSCDAAISSVWSRPRPRQSATRVSPSVARGSRPAG